MDELIQIGQRIKGLRDALDLPIDKFAKSCGISVDELKAYESGEKDLTIRTLKKISDTYNVDITTLMFDEEPRMNSYSLTRKGKGLEIKRVDVYKYKALASGFANREADIFEVTVEPIPNHDGEIHQSSHEGQEFNLVLEGKLMIRINGKDLILEKGDSIYYNSSVLHGMKALDGKRVKFLAVIL